MGFIQLKGSMFGEKKKKKKRMLPKCIAALAVCK